MNANETPECFNPEDAVKNFMSDGKVDFSKLTYSWDMVRRMLESCRYLSIESGKDDEREEWICRLLASGMSAQDISLIRNIRIENITPVEQSNAKIKIPDYAKKLNSRRKYREKQKRSDSNASCGN